MAQKSAGLRSVLAGNDSLTVSNGTDVPRLKLVRNARRTAFEKFTLAEMRSSGVRGHFSMQKMSAGVNRVTSLCDRLGYCVCVILHSGGANGRARQSTFPGDRNRCRLLVCAAQDNRLDLRRRFVRMVALRHLWTRFESRFFLTSNSESSLDEKKRGTVKHRV